MPRPLYFPLTRGRTALLTFCAVLLAAAFLVLGSAPASAQSCSGSSSIDDDGFGASGFCLGNDPGRPPRDVYVGDLWVQYCEYAASGDAVPFDPLWAERYSVTFEKGDDLTQEEMESFSLPLTGTFAFYTISCRKNNHYGAGSDAAYIGGTFIFTIDDPIDPRVLRDEAAARIGIVEPTLMGSPDFMADNPSVVHIETWFWTTDAWTRRSEGERQGFAEVQVFAEPVHIDWVFGDGEDLRCEGPGIAWSADAEPGGTYCGHEYVSTSADQSGQQFAGTATILWSFRWTFNGVDQGEFQQQTRTSAFSVAVGEIQALSGSS